MGAAVPARQLVHNQPSRRRGHTRRRAARPPCSRRLPGRAAGAGRGAVHRPAAPGAL